MTKVGSKVHLIYFYFYGTTKWLVADADCEVESESLAELRNDKDHETVRSCILVYLRTKLGGDNGSNIIDAVAHTTKQDDLSKYFPPQVHLITLDIFLIIMMIFDIRRSLYVKSPKMGRDFFGSVLPGTPARHSIAGLTRLSNKTLFKPVWAYVNASTTIIPNAIDIRQQGPNEVNFTTWKNSYGMDLQVTDFGKFDWEYEGKLHFSEQLKIAKTLGLFNRWNENDISLKGRDPVCTSISCVKF